MIQKITELTKEQEGKLPEYAEKWISLGLSAQKIDREKANAAINEVYSSAGLKPPKVRIWLRSPYEGVIGAWWLKQVLKSPLKSKAMDLARAKIAVTAGEHAGDQVGDKVRSDILAEIRTQLKPQLGARVEALVKDKLGEPIKDQVRDGVWGHVWNQIKEQHAKPQLADPVWGQVWSQLSTQVWAQDAKTAEQTGTVVRAEIGSQVGGQLGTQIEDLLGTQSVCAGLHEANLLGPYDFFGKELGINVRKLSGLVAAAEHCGWFWPFNGAVIITEKPSEFHHDNKNRLHDEKDMAIKYSDGWGVGIWHGTRVENWVITNPELITLDKVLDEKNAGARRVMRERFGLQDFFIAMMKDNKVQKISRKKDPLGMPMALYRYLEKEGPLHFVHVYNGVTEADGTRKEFILTCKNVCDDAWDSLLGSYPELMEELKDNPRKYEIIKASIR